MAETIVFPSATSAVIAAFSAALPALVGPIAVAGTVPNPRPARLVRVSRTGGTKQTLVTDAAQLTIEAWAATEVEAHDVAQAARAVLHTLPGAVVELPGGDEVAVYRVDEFSGPAHLPDPLSSHARFTFTVSVHIRGRAAS